MADLSLPFACDLLIAASGTQFSFPEVDLGVMPGAGGTQRLTKLVGRTKALNGSGRVSGFLLKRL